VIKTVEITKYICTFCSIVKKFESEYNKAIEFKSDSTKALEKYFRRLFAIRRLTGRNSINGNCMKTGLDEMEGFI